MRTLGIDPSLNGTGLAVGENKKIIHTETITIKKLRGMDRVNFILHRLDEIIKAYDIKEVVIEGYSFGSRGRALFQLGELGGVIRYYLFLKGLSIKEIPPTSLKKATTGKGNAKKDEMLQAVRDLSGLNLTDHNQADAVALLLAS